MNPKVFKGANVFMSRNLVPPELFDKLHDALKLNGANVFLCCDPSRNAPIDYHIISSPDHEKFEGLMSKGCNLLGPHCVLTCAKENRPLPNRGFTCCLAMDGVKVLASGFDINEKVAIGKLVTGMGGVFHPKASMDVSFVIVKDVLAAKYKWALNELKKPIVTKNWVDQCWKEHRVVPQEPFKVLPFSGLRIAVSRIPAVERKEMENIILQNGGNYSAELTRKCTHLVPEVIVIANSAPGPSIYQLKLIESVDPQSHLGVAPEGDKYTVAKQWGHIRIVTKKWFVQSLARRACLNEESYPVQSSSASSLSFVRKKARHSQELGTGISQVAASSYLSASVYQDPEITFSQNISSMVSDVPIVKNDGEAELPPLHPKDDHPVDDCVADDSQTDDNDLYLSECRILIVGFDASEMRKLVNMVRRGGGSRYMSFNEKLTHIIVGSPSETELKETRTLAAFGIIYVVKREWLEDCDRERKEFPVYQRHIPYDVLRPKDPIGAFKKASSSVNGVKEGRPSAVNITDAHRMGNGNYVSGMSLDKTTEPEIAVNKESSMGMTGHIKRPKLCSLKDKGQLKVQGGSRTEIGEVESSNVFKGRLFCFSPSFPEERRGEIIHWIHEGRGEIVEDCIGSSAQFIVECHGVVPSDAALGTYVSSHWIRCSLEEGRLLDVGSHILYSPLPCQVPFPGLGKFKLCVSQYDEKERVLLRNLCFVLKIKFSEKLTKSVTHLLCKFASGPKYEAACKWGVQSVTADWLYECIKQNKVIDPGSFHPKEATSQDQVAGQCTTSQYPTQTIRMLSGSQSLEFKTFQNDSPSSKTITCEETVPPSSCRKRGPLEVENPKCILSLESKQIYPNLRIPSTESREESAKNGSINPDEAAVIEDLLEQTSKIKDHKSSRMSLIPFDCSIRGQASDSAIGDQTSVCSIRDQASACSIREASACSIDDQDQGYPRSAFGLYKDCKDRFDSDEYNTNRTQGAAAEVYVNFSETQSDSQVVGYAKDLSGIQEIIDKARNRSSKT